MQKPIFLHFLNREAAEAIDWNPKHAGVVSILNVLLLTNCSRLTVNISQMLEFASDKPVLISKLAELFQNEILFTTSSSNNVAEFIESRKRLYNRTPKRYPMYFEHEDTAQRFSISQNNSFSMTDNLRRDLLNVSEGELALFARRARAEDIRIFLENLSAFQKIIYKEEHLPITKSTINAIANSGDLSSVALNSCGRIFSALYNEHYAARNNNATCSGVYGRGFEDDLTDFPHYDVPVLRSLISSLGWQEIKLPRAPKKIELYGSYGNFEHRVFVQHIHAFLHACAAQVSQNLGDVSEYRAIPSERQSIITLANNLLDHKRCHGTPENIINFYNVTCEWIQKAAVFACERYSAFDATWKAVMPPKVKLSFLLHTATPVEDMALQSALEQAGYSIETHRAINRGFVHRFTRGGTVDIFHVRSNAGSVGPNGSELSASDAIASVNPQFVISVGICFGLKSDEHRIGDVCVSDVVADYETVRLGEDEVRERGNRCPSGSTLVSAVNGLKVSYVGNDVPNIRNGLILSGQKLSDSKPFALSLKERFPDAIAGEMEAVGVMSSAQRNSIEWIVIKSICDWGYDKKKDDQELAAKNAAKFAVKVVDFILSAERG
jgi:nucleoside phosphorylase